MLQRPVALGRDLLVISTMRAYTLMRSVNKRHKFKQKDVTIKIKEPKATHFLPVVPYMRTIYAVMHATSFL